MTNEDEPSSQGPYIADATGEDLQDVDPDSTTINSGISGEFWGFMSQLPGILFSRRWWWATLLVIAGMLLLVRLGFWQLSRLEWRRNLNAQLVQQLEAAPLDLSSSPLPGDIEALKDRQATARGKFDYESQVLLTQQSWQGQPGAHLITPLFINELGMAVLVDRGWIPAAEAAQENLSIYDDGTDAWVEGVIRNSERLPGARYTPGEIRKEWYRVDIEGIETQLPYELMPIYLQWLPDESSGELPFRAEPEIDLSEGSHLSYAIQWFSFAVILLAGYIALIYQQGKRHSLSSKSASSIIDSQQE